jgi:putative inorganic carbon (hco3(-)) transporter
MTARTASSLDVTVPTLDARSNLQWRMRRAALYLAYASAASILVSIAVSQILLGMALITLLVSGERLRFPPIRLPLALFFVGTVLAVLLSPDPYRGVPQIRKFYVFFIVLVIFSTFKSVKQIRTLVLVWSVIALLSALLSLVQFVQRYREAQVEHANNYGFFLDDRIRGFSSHWMTFGGTEMIVFLMLLSFLLFSGKAKWKVYGVVCLGILWISLVLGLTRSIFLLGVPMGALYLIWHWRRWLVLLAPTLVVLAIFASPVQVRERVISVVHPHEELDSNTHRSITRRTGWEMVKAHPWFGLGPEQIAPQFLRYVPADIPKPLPKGYYGHLHNVYLQYAAERGVPTMLLMIWLIGKVLFDFLRAIRDRALSKDAQFVLHGAVATILALLAEGYFEYNLGDSEVLTLFLTVVTCGYVVLRAPDVASQPITS